jgi:HSP20 family protein
MQLPSERKTSERESAQQYDAAVGVRSAPWDHKQYNQGGSVMTMPARRSGGTPTTWHPLRGFDDIYSEFDRLVQSVMGGPGSDSAWMPAADVSETEAAYVVEIELPGVRREDVNVELDGNELIVSGELKERSREGLLRRRTRRVGNFEYRVILPGDLRSDDVEASLAHGVLTVHVPKAQATKHNKIEVTDSSSS